MKLTILGKTKNYPVEVSETYLKDLRKKDMPGISLGKLVMFRDKYAKELDDLFPCRFTEGKCDVLNEVLSFFVFAMENYEKAEQQIKQLFTDCFYLINDNFKDTYESFTVDIKNWIIYPDKSLLDSKHMNKEDRIMISKQLKKGEK